MTDPTSSELITLSEHEARLAVQYLPIGATANRTLSQQIVAKSQARSALMWDYRGQEALSSEEVSALYPELGHYVVPEKERAALVGVFAVAASDNDFNALGGELELDEVQSLAQAAQIRLSQIH